MALRLLALIISSSLFFGSADVTKEPNNSVIVFDISSTAKLKATSFTFDGFCDPVTLRTNCNAAARISVSVAGGSKLKRGFMFLHTMYSVLKTYLFIVI